MDTSRGGLVDKNVLNNPGNGVNIKNQIINEIGLNFLLSTDDDSQVSSKLINHVVSDYDDDTVDDGQFVFHRSKHNKYLPVI